MKEKIERFNQDEQLRDMAYKRSLNRWANERDKQDMYEKGIAEGVKQGGRDHERKDREIQPR